VVGCRVGESVGGGVGGSGIKVEDVL
jgi:hypothetical protein